MIGASEKLKLQIRENRGPLYLQIATSMRRDIETGNLHPGSRLPSLNQLAQNMGVSLITVRQAVAMLESEGLLKRRQGKGTFVTDDPLSRQWLVLNSDWSSLLSHLHDKKPTMIQMADTIAEPRVGPDEGQLAPSYRHMRRVHHWNDTAYAVIDIYLERQTYLQCPERFDANMVIATLADMPEVKIENLHQTFSFTTADPETAALLKVPINAPIGDVRRVITASDRTILYVGETKYRGDFVKVDINIKR